MAWSQSDVDKLKAVIADGKGVRSVTFADQQITFHSIEDMLKLLAVMQQDVDEGLSKSRHFRYAAISKGV